MAFLVLFLMILQLVFDNLQFLFSCQIAAYLNNYLYTQTYTNKKNYFKIKLSQLFLNPIILFGL